ncbi:MAG: hypothetical protein GW795_03225 [Cyanobacteria bacterium]|nr:hypothetical protein [Cyanobacteria bacterium CG_2015-04_32_10]
MKPNLETIMQAIQNNEIDKAQKLLETIENSIDKAEVDNLKGIIKASQGDFQIAISHFEKSISQNKNNINYYSNALLCYEKLHKYENAVITLQQLLRLGATKKSIQNHLHVLFGIFPENEVLIKRLVNQLQGDNIDINLLDKLGLFYTRKNLYSQALYFYKLAISLSPDNQHLLNNYFLCLMNTRQYEKCIHHLTIIKEITTLQSAVDCYIAIFELLNLDWDNYEKKIKVISNEVEKCLRDPNKQLSIITFEVLKYIDDKAINLAVAKKETAYQPKTIYKHKANIHDKNKRLRVGFVSGDFYKHPTMILANGLFKYLKQNKIDTYIYSLALDDGSEYHANLKKHSDKFTYVINMTLAEIAKTMYDDQLDIIIDLQGLTSLIYLKAFAYRPAPLQMEFLVFPGTTGADYIDYIIADKIVAPPEHQAFYTEKFLYMPNCYQVNDDQRIISQTNVMRADYGLPESKFIYCCFCTLYKIEPTIFAIWMNILKAVPNSILWLLKTSEQQQNKLRDYAEQQGVAGERLIFSDKEENSPHLRRLQLADLTLDTYIVGAHTTASDALWAGIPILTCTGDRFISRVCTSLLHTQGLTELITDNLQQYQERAIYYGQHPEEIKKLKQKIQKTNKTKPLFDTALYAKDFSRALRLAWERYCDGLPPDTMAVEKE